MALPIAPPPMAPHGRPVRGPLLFATNGNASVPIPGTSSGLLGALHYCPRQHPTTTPTITPTTTPPVASPADFARKLRDEGFEIFSGTLMIVNATMLPALFAAPLHGSAPPLHGSTPVPSHPRTAQPEHLPHRSFCPSLMIIMQLSLPYHAAVASSSCSCRFLIMQLSLPHRSIMYAPLQAPHTSLAPCSPIADSCPPVLCPGPV